MERTVGYGQRSEEVRVRGGIGHGDIHVCVRLWERNAVGPLRNLCTLKTIMRSGNRRARIHGPTEYSTSSSKSMDSFLLQDMVEDDGERVKVQGLIILSAGRESCECWEERRKR